MALSVSPGQIVASGDWDALFTQHGGMPQNQQSILRPPTEKEIQAAAQGGDDDPGFNQRPIYRYTLADGSIVEARTARNGTDWEVVDYKPSAKFQETQKPAAQNANRPTTRRIEGTPLPGGGFDNTKPIAVNRDANGQQVGPSEALTAAERAQWEREKNPGGLTDEEVRQQNQTAETRQPVASHPGYTQVTTKKGTTQETYYLDPNGNRVNALPEKPTTAALVGSPTGNTRERTENGTKIKEVEYVLPNGTKEWRAQTAATSQIPSSTPPFVPDWSKPGLGVVEYANAIRGRTDLTDDQKKEVIAAAHTNATATVSQANSLIDAQQTEAGRQTTQRGQDVTQANARLEASSANFGNALKAAQEGTKYSVGPDAGAVLPYYLAQASGQAAAYGGLNTPPAVQPGTAIGQVNRMGIPGLPDVLGATGPWGSGGTTPNPINAGAPGMPATAPSGAEVEAENQAAQAGFNNAVGPLLTPPTPVPGILPNVVVPQEGTTPPVNPMPGQPGSNPNAPIGMAPTDPTMAAMLGAGPWQQQAAPDPTGMAQMVAMQGQQAMMGYDPRVANQESLEMGFDPDIIEIFGGGLA